VIHLYFVCVIVNFKYISFFQIRIVLNIINKNDFYIILLNININIELKI